MFPLKNIFCVGLLFFSLMSWGQNHKTNWFLAPEVSGIFRGDHLGRAVGFRTGFEVWKENLQIGFFYYGRSGPINDQTYVLELPSEKAYKGKTSLQLGADHAAFGLVLEPKIALSSKLKLHIPLSLGQLGAGFYLKDADRITPDGRRVSEWENELMDSMDAGFGWLVEPGVRLGWQLNANQAVQLGLHYSQTIGWETFIGGTDFYNKFRLSLAWHFSPGVQ